MDEKEYDGVKHLTMLCAHHADKQMGQEGEYVLELCRYALQTIGEPADSTGEVAERARQYWKERM
jgi:hypothetical protein